MNAQPEQLNIVVADDSRVYRKLVEDALARDEYKVSFAKNGREALELVSGLDPAVLVTDWEMPDVTGLELCKKIRQAHGAYTYVILLTSNTMKDQIIQGLDAGADDYLTKPFHPGELLARVAVGRRVAQLHRQVSEKNRLLEELALTDPLTGLPNRRAVEDWAKRELSGAVRHGFSLWVVMADLDHFKSVNDTYGHDAGDFVLERFAAILKANTRASNMCGRIGGEEFVLVLGHTDREGVQIAIERLRQHLEKEVFTFGTRVLRVTASFGVSGFRRKEAAEFNQLLREADGALYSAKRRGRNRIEFAETKLGTDVHIRRSWL
jgi:diguanylate cyclase (GGDEF)-like protein